MDYEGAKRYLTGLLAQVPQNARGLLNDARTIPQQLAGLLSPQMNQQVQAAYAKPQPANPQQWIDAGMNLAGMAPVGGLIGHTVYHGSPHKFTAFDMSKIGTGEGNQAFGHGLYFAEAPSVAEDYARMNLNGPANVAYRAGKDGGDSLAALKRTYPGMPNAWYDNAIRKATEEGNLYKVDIPDESIPRMLDWDRTLSSQSNDVLKGLGLTNKQAHDWTMDQSSRNADTSARAFYKQLTGMLGGPDKASEFLKSKGIPGIRYMDGNSRNSLQGTSNYVLFDDKLPRILEVNGNPTGLKPWSDK